MHADRYFSRANNEATCQARGCPRMSASAIHPTKHPSVCGSFMFVSQHCIWKACLIPGDLASKPMIIDVVCNGVSGSVVPELSVPTNDSPRKQDFDASYDVCGFLVLCDWKRSQLSLRCMKTVSPKGERASGRKCGALVPLLTVKAKASSRAADGTSISRQRRPPNRKGCLPPVSDVLMAVHKHRPIVSSAEYLGSFFSVPSCMLDATCTRS